jgi:hypothetical protein
MRRRPFFMSLALVALATAAPALAVDPPYLKLAQALGAPQLVDSIGPADHSYLQLKFTPNGETAAKFTKLVTISILKVPTTREDTESAARGVIVRLRDGVRERKADIQTFDESPIAPVTLFYEFSGDGDISKGIVYSPRVGYVTAAQVDVKNGGTISRSDVAELKNIIAQAQAKE